MAGTENESCEARWRRADHERAAAWQRAVDKLSITFEAEQGGGCPDILLQAGKPEERLALLKGLGFKVLRHFDIDVSMPGEEPCIELWVVLSGHICVNLSAGWVGKTSGR